VGLFTIFICSIEEIFNVVFIRVCHIRVIKFPMLPANHRVQGNDLVYKLPEYAEDGIRQSIVAVKL